MKKLVVARLPHLLGCFGPANAGSLAGTDDDRVAPNVDLHILLEARALDDRLGKADAAGVTDSDKSPFHSALVATL